MNLFFVAADVREAQTSGSQGDQSLLTSAATVQGFNALRFFSGNFPSAGGAHEGGRGDAIADGHFPFLHECLGPDSRAS